MKIFLNGISVSLITMHSLFQGTTAFNGDLSSSWDVSSVTVTDISNRFYNANAFSGKLLSSWVVSSIGNILF